MKLVSPYLYTQNALIFSYLNSDYGGGVGRCDSGQLIVILHVNII